MQVRYSYLSQQFSQVDDMIGDLRSLVASGDFTLGKPVAEFEDRFANLIGAKHAIGVGSGTDALKLSLRGLGVGHGDEVVTAANTFIATVGAIVETGAKPVLVDCDDTLCIDPALIERAITHRTKALLPVHLTGYVADMAQVMEIAKKHELLVVEDACQAIYAERSGTMAGTFGNAAGFSLHPLKNLNVWGDAGVIVTSDDALADRLRLLRNHGLRNRDEVEILGCNSRLDSVQAVIGNRLIGQTTDVTRKRIENAQRYDAGFKDVPQIRLPPRLSGMRMVYHLYVVFCQDRDGLFAHCHKMGIECKIHYPTPLYLQPGLRYLGYKLGDFPVTDRHAASLISFPADQHLTNDEIDHVISVVRSYYGL
jgi:aminotransferase EvaB